ncbi:MAG: hypothetical protein WCA08_22175 [Desulfoferrobacter sp.]
MKSLEKRIANLESSCGSRNDQEEIPACLLEIMERVHQKAAEIEKEYGDVLKGDTPEEQAGIDAFIAEMDRRVGIR